MSISQLYSYLQEQQPILEGIVAAAANAYLHNAQKQDNFSYDIAKCQAESFNLIQGQDLCYDRPNTALAYSLWYHPRRVNTFLSHFADKLLALQNTSGQLTIFDLGAGTGAVQWSIGLIHNYFIKNSISIPPIRIVNVDSSPFMLAYSKDFLWPAFVAKFPNCASLNIEYSVNSWKNTAESLISNTWICASYLFDISDDKSLVRDDFVLLTGLFNPSNIFLLSSNQAQKIALLNNIKDLLLQKKYTIVDANKAKLLFTGRVHAVNEVRQQLYGISGVQSLQRQANWDDVSFYGLVLSKIDGTFNFPTVKASKIDIFNPPFKVRREIVLSSEQSTASKFSDKPSVIIGPAGCGKSVVVTEKIINTLKQQQFRKDIQILVTTFNKDLLGKLGDWLEELLLKEKVHFTRVKDLDYYNNVDGSGYFTFSGSNVPNVKLLHFDMLPKKIGGLKYTFSEEWRHRDLLDKIIRDVCLARNVLAESYPAILNSDFLLEEYHRVIYGLQCKISHGEPAYQAIKRSGRGSKLDPGIHRQLVWECLASYAHYLHANPHFQSFTTRRQLFLNNIKAGQVGARYDFIFIDEFQDCTLADFEIFWGLVKDVNNICIAGDIAQAVHIGKSARIPRDERMKRREIHRLRGSYRLPVRISECIVEISRKIKLSNLQKDGVEEISPYKGSPPGARPIVVYGKTPKELAQKLAKVHEAYKCFDIGRITILERDNKLWQEIHSAGIPVETSTILKLKGLEKEFVVWSSSANIEFEKEVKEFVYTILTRTSCILVIAIDDATPEIVKPLLSLFRKDRLIYWDSSSEQMFNDYCRPYIESSQEEEVDVDVEDQLL